MDKAPYLLPNWTKFVFQLGCTFPLTGAEKTAFRLGQNYVLSSKKLRFRLENVDFERKRRSVQDAPLWHLRLLREENVVVFAFFEPF